MDHVIVQGGDSTYFIAATQSHTFRAYFSLAANFIFIILSTEVIVAFGIPFYVKSALNIMKCSDLTI